MLLARVGGVGIAAAVLHLGRAIALLHQAAGPAAEALERLRVAGADAALASTAINVANPIRTIAMTSSVSCG